MTHSTDIAAMNRLLAEEMPADSRAAQQMVRRREIAETVIARGSLRIEALAEQFDISLMTAHRDLDELAARGLVHKSRGLVSAIPTTAMEANGAYRAAQQSGEKRAIAAAAAELVSPGETLFLDDSTTVRQMAPLLEGRRPLTVITNALPLMNAFQGMRDLTLLGLGGQFDAGSNAFVGRMTVAEVGRLRADTAFLSLAAILDGVAFGRAPDMVETKRAMFDATDRRVLLADHTKFNRRAMHGLAAIDEFDAIIVDDRLSVAQMEDLRTRPIEVIVAETGA